ncbi:chalcone isomerase [Blastocladiella britannica]|nr:chalcone isomerase [Blastocladiella britannica]
MVLPVGPAKTPTRFVAVGHGPRQVTFLSINVYTIALYIPDTPAARAALAAACSDSAASLDRLATDPATRDLVLYLTPARATTAAHLRDGFVRTFMDAVSRATGAAAVKAGTIAAADAVATRDRMLSDIDRFKTEFPPSAVDKGHVYLFRRPAGSEGLEISLHGKTVGTIQSEWMAAALSTAYLRADKPLSPKLRESIVQFPSPAAIKEGM